jgi:hypothetical protein
MDDDLTYRMTNREKAREPRCRTRSIWCFGCDARQVREYEKCSHCGGRSGKRREKKPTPIC